MGDQLTAKQVQELGIGIIRSIDKYAKEHSIRYYLAGGTLLGAVRHNGYIPWDDDVDLMMPRPDYDSFIRNYTDTRYKVSSCECDNDYNTPFARVWDTKTELEFTSVVDKKIGVFVDIFPIDGYPRNNMISKIHTYRLKYYRAKINSAVRKSFSPKDKRVWIKKAMGLLWHQTGNTYSKRLNRLGQKYSFEDSEYVGVTTTTDHIFRERNSKAIFSETSYLDFEGMKLPAPSGYDIYLKKLYGDYMKLPPEDKRVSEHLFKSRMCEEGGTI